VGAGARRRAPAPPGRDAAELAAIDPAPLLRLGVRYAPLPAVRARLWSLGAERATRPRSFVVRTRYGFRFAGDQRLIMPRCVYWFGHWLSRSLHATLRTGDVVVDVGANTGWYTLLAATAVGPSGRVVAIEPAASTRVALERNLARNRAANVRTVASAVGAEEGSVPFFRGENDAESSTVQRRGLAPDGEVPTAPLPHLLTPEEAARVALVKIDVEGGEADVLRGMVQDAAWMPARLRIVVEVHVHHLVRAGVAPADLLAPFRAIGFAATWLPVAFDEASHLHPPTDATPRQPPFPDGDLFHLILARG